MQMNDISGYLESIYNISVSDLGSSSVVTVQDISENIEASLELILKKSESAKGVLTVIITSLVHKIFYKSQDIRYHQANMENGYSGRSFDTAFITPFLKRKNFPAMAESGWLTRSLEQNRPYDKDYSGSIRPKELKDAFLDIIDTIQQDICNEMLLRYILQYLILQRNKFDILLAKPTNLSLNKVTFLLEKHFSSKYASEGAARLPSLAFYAVYQCMIKELKRFNGKTLLPIENHTSSDRRSGTIGDINIIDSKQRYFEAVEIKHGIEITPQLIVDAYNKFCSTPVKRYYILSTVGIKRGEERNISIEIEKIKHIHGCQVIVNGIIDSLHYYIRLLDDPFDFIECYVLLLEKDTSIKFEHKKMWNDLINTV
jgi:DNA (cytosine-5)-methyltransferase 1